MVERVNFLLKLRVPDAKPLQERDPEPGRPLVLIVSVDTTATASQL